jgi:hypothetical protein
MVFLHVSPCSLLNEYRFGGTYCSIFWTEPSTEHGCATILLIVLRPVISLHSSCAFANGLLRGQKLKKKIPLLLVSPVTVSDTRASCSETTSASRTWRQQIPSNSRRQSPSFYSAVRTSQKTHYVSAAETNRLILFGETVAVYCENTQMQCVDRTWSF